MSRSALAALLEVGVALLPVASDAVSATPSAKQRAVPLKVQDRAMLGVAPVPVSARTGVASAARRRLEAAAVAPSDYVVRRHFWTVPESALDLQVYWDRKTPKGMSSDGSDGDGPGSAL